MNYLISFLISTNLFPSNIWFPYFNCHFLNRRHGSTSVGRWKCWTPWMTWAQGAVCNGHRLVKWWNGAVGDAPWFLGERQWESYLKCCWMWNLTVGWCEICEDFWVSGISRLIWQGFGQVQSHPISNTLLKSVKISQKKAIGFWEDVPKDQQFVAPWVWVKIESPLDPLILLLAGYI